MYLILRVVCMNPICTVGYVGMNILLPLHDLSWPRLSQTTFPFNIIFLTVHSRRRETPFRRDAHGIPPPPLRHPLPLSSTPHDSSGSPPAQGTTRRGTKSHSHSASCRDDAAAGQRRRGSTGIRGDFLPGTEAAERANFADTHVDFH